jgi:hypothetical protein
VKSDCAFLFDVSLRQIVPYYTLLALTKMGLYPSKHRRRQQQQTSQHDIIKNSKNNDYELVIRACKELEYILEHDFEAQGRGLQAKISNAATLRSSRNHGIHVFSQDLVRDMRYIANIRHKLTHEHGFDAPIPNRDAFEEAFTRSMSKLEQEVLAITTNNKNSNRMNRSDSGGHFRKAPTSPTPTTTTTTAMQKRRQQRPRRQYDLDDDVDPFLVGCGGGGCGGGDLSSCIIS